MRLYRALKMSGSTLCLFCVVVGGCGTGSPTDPKTDTGVEDVPPDVSELVETDVATADVFSSDTLASDTPIDTTFETATVDSGDADTVETWPTGWTSFEDEVLIETNKRRAAGARCGFVNYPPVPPLTMDVLLRKSARNHAKEMADYGYLDHTSRDGKSSGDRIAAAGYAASATAENIARGNPTPAGTVQQWIDSSGHCKALMSATYVHIGVGYAFNASVPYKHYWVQNFGKP